jgi:serine/threonine protein kinase/uncharacterized membrane protein YobD (UPF0266 family)
MNAERFRQVRNLFEAAVEKEPESRAGFLASATAGDADLRERVERLLEAHEQTVTFLDGSLTAPESLRTDPSRLEGRRLGVYEVLREIGRGGMGTVYLARRADGLFEQLVAIKVVNPDPVAPEVIERFHQERQILASLEHPNIARIFDAGNTEEGWPYFVMEYVQGKPIDVWCDERRLDLSERLRLFRSVCAAVHYAHQHRVIHRDLKPSNILVTEVGEVKLLDFGIAKLVRRDMDATTRLETQAGLRLMTPEYASPEQVRGEEVTPLTDVYALGVVLYELLTGRRPYRLKSRVLHEVVRIISEEPPVRPSTAVLREEIRTQADGLTLTIAPGLMSAPREGSPIDLKRRLSGDLDGILLRTLEKEPLRRYRSAELLSQDIERHLKGQRVEASVEGPVHRLQRRLNRHRTGLLLGLGIGVAYLSGGLWINRTGAAAIIACAALLGIWRIATDKTLGPRISYHFSGPGPFVVLLLLPLAASIILPPPVAGWPRTWLLMSASGLAIAAAVLLSAAWLSRSYWAGELLLAVKTPEDQTLALVMVALQAIMQLRDLAAKGSRLEYVLLAGFFVSMLLYGWLATRHIEFRERGILYRGRLLPWLRIERYCWEKHSPPTGLASLDISGRVAKDVIRLEMQRLFTFLPPVRIRVPVENRAEITSILDRHLSIWPDGPHSSDKVSPAECPLGYQSPK